MVLGNSFSSWSPVGSGVPQGSVLGPTLFIAYINDMAIELRNTCKLYVDDCKIMAKIRSQPDEINLQLDLDAVTRWSRMWLMELNTGKCKVMHCRRHNPHAEYMISLVN